MEIDSLFVAVLSWVELGTVLLVVNVCAVDWMNKQQH